MHRAHANNIQCHPPSLRLQARILTIERFLEEDFRCCKARAEQARATEQQQLKAPSTDRASAPHGDGKAPAASDSESFDGTARCLVAAHHNSVWRVCSRETRFLEIISDTAAKCVVCSVQQYKKSHPTQPCYHQWSLRSVGLRAAAAKILDAAALSPLLEAQLRLWPQLSPHCSSLLCRSCRSDHSHCASP